MTLELARGMRDIQRQDALLREYITNTITRLFQRYGFAPLDTPIIEKYDVLSAKFAAGEESDAMGETYTLQDNGGRELGLRFDLTVPLARYVGMNRTLRLPFKRYQIGKVYRDAPIKYGRYREFTQCDADIIGSKSMLADATCILLALDVYTELGVDVKIKVNNRTLLTELMSTNGIETTRADSLIMTIDKLDKIGIDGVLDEAKNKGFETDTVKKIVDLISMKGTNEEKLSFFKNMLPESKGIEELNELFSFVDNDDVVFEPTLARGLGYYTGTVYEIFSKTDDSIGSLGGGGRYDDLIGNYLSNDGTSTTNSFSAVGVSFGLDRIVDVLKQLQDTSFVLKTVDLFIVPLGTEKESFDIAKQLRNEGISVDVDMMGRGPSKNFKYADKQDIPFVAIIGEDEIKANTITIKELADGNEKQYSLEDCISFFKRRTDQRKSDK
ncbi:MAG: histidine--tRNA ligase [Nanobdellota archaeon]